MEKKIKKIYLLKEIDSTQNYAKTLIDTGLNPLDRTLIIAKKQSEGRGRFYRKWHSPPGGIYLSFILSNFEIIQRICIDTSLALVKLTKELYGLQVYIKWPNDIILENKKLSGILIETYKNHLIIGVGYNLNISPQDLPPKAISIYQILNKKQSIKEWVNKFIEYLNTYLNKPVSENLYEFKTYSYTLGKFVHVRLANSKKIEGFAIDVDTNGELIIRTPQGLQEKISSAEVLNLR